MRTLDRRVRGDAVRRGLQRAEHLASMAVSVRRFVRALPRPPWVPLRDHFGPATGKVRVNAGPGGGDLGARVRHHNNSLNVTCALTFGRGSGRRSGKLALIPEFASRCTREP